MTSTPGPRPPLDPSRLPDHVEIVAATPSTNADLAAQARAGAPDGTVLVTEHQTRGRGRLDRGWETPDRSSLTFSVLRRPQLPPQAWPWIPLLVGYAVQAALADRLPAIGLKWPNDVLVEDRKLAGILVERVDTPEGPAAIIGIGLNVDQNLDELPVALATSITLELGRRPDRTEVLAQILGSLEGLWPLLDDLDGLRAAYSDACLSLGRGVRVDLPGGEQIAGTALGIDRDGRLVVGTETGELTVAAGDVVHASLT